MKYVWYVCLVCVLDSWVLDSAVLACEEVFWLCETHAVKSTKTCRLLISLSCSLYPSGVFVSLSFDFIGPHSENLLLFEDFSSASCKHHTQRILPHYHIHRDLFSHTSHLQVWKVIGIKGKLKPIALHLTWFWVFWQILLTKYNWRVCDERVLKRLQRHYLY